MTMKHILRFLLLAVLAVGARAADLSITAANVIPSANAELYRKTAAATITAGQTVYLLAAGTVGLADANGASPLYNVYGIAVTGGGAGQVITVCRKDPALVIGATLTIGDTLWLSATAGGITITAADNVTGMYVTALGVAGSTTAFNFNPTAAGAVKP